MRKGIYIIGAMLVALLLLGESCGGGRSPAKQTIAAPIPTVKMPEGTSQKPRTYAFTDEDYKVMAMSYEDRLAYLEQRFRELVFELHGIVIEESVTTSRETSDKNNSNHMVEENDSEPLDPLKDNEEIQDYLKLELVSSDRRWDLSFLERVQGDYSFNGTVAISDITPLAVNFGHEWDPIEEHWPENWDPHLRRVSNGDGKISIADITPIAVNFGLVLEAYNVYHAPAGNNNWTEEPVFTWDASTYREEPGEEYPYYANYRAIWEDEFEEEDLPDIEVETNDKLMVVPVFNTGEGGVDTWSDPMYFTLPPNVKPTADITAVPTAGEQPLLVRFNASGSTDSDGTIEQYDYDWEGDGTYDLIDGGISPTHIYPAAATYTATLRVTDDDDDTGTDSVTITVTGPPAVYDWSATPNPVETGVEVTFEVNAEDTDGTGLTRVEYYITLGQQPDYTETPGDLKCQHTFSPEDWVLLHSKVYDCKVVVTDSEDSTTKYLSDFGGALTVEHAVPVISLTTPSNPVCIMAGDPVFFDASQSTDADGPDLWSNGQGRPTQYYFDFGNNESYAEEEGEIPDDGLFDGKTSYDGWERGIYTASIYVYDEYYDPQKCNLWEEKHVSSATVKVWVFGEPTVKGDEETVDDGNHYIDGAGWHNLGVPSIAIDIDPDTGLPGVAYVGAPNAEDKELDWPLQCVLYSEKTAAIEGWSDPVMVWANTFAEKNAYIGQQCDLTYSPSLGTPWIATTIDSNPAVTNPPQPIGIILYDGSSGWAYDWLVDNNTVSFAAPIRLVSIVANNGGNFVTYKYLPGEQEDNALMEICDQAGLNQYVVVESRDDDIGMSHDQKPYQGNPYQRKNATVYTHSLGMTDLLLYEVLQYNPFALRYDWEGTFDVLSPPAPSTLSTRLAALDYFSSVAGSLWVDYDLDLDFTMSGLQSIEEVDTDVGLYCDFDFDNLLGVPCVAYEKDVSGETLVYVQVYMNEGWLDLPIEIANLGEEGVSYLDLDVAEGYIFVVYAKDGDICCRVLDFFGRP